jgi:hypothetical protein
VGGRHVEAKLGDQARQPGRLSFRQLEDKSRERGRVDDRVFERALQPAPDEPSVEGVVAVLDQHRTVGKTQESAARVFELRRADEHRAVDVVSLAGVRVDRRPAVDEGVEEGQGAVECEALGAELQDEEGRIAGRLHV